MAETLTFRFRESTLSAWGICPSGHGLPLPDASWKNIGSISSVNQVLANQGLQYPTEQLFCRPSSDSSVAVDPFPSHKDWSMGQGKKRSKRAPTKKPSQTEIDETPVKIEEEVKTPVPPPEKTPSTTNGDSKLVELASFPGFDPHHPTPIPHGLDPLEQMQRTSRAQTMLSVKREGFRETWKKLFYHTASQAIFQDYFWWFFLHKYQNSKFLAVQSQFFNRISGNYVALLCEDIDLRWKDSFFKVYPDMIAQCVYTTFLHAYPASWNSFDNSFKSALITIISLWQVGTRPLTSAWKKWNFGVLEPTNQMKHLSKQTSNDSGASCGNKSPKKNTFELDALLSEYKVNETNKTVNKVTPERDTKERVRISITNFDQELAESLANEEIHISASKERLVKTQVQATRQLLTKRARRDVQPSAEPPPGARLSPMSAKKSSLRPKSPAKVTKSLQSLPKTRFTLAIPPKKDLSTEKIKNPSFVEGGTTVRVKRGTRAPQPAQNSTQPITHTRARTQQPTNTKAMQPSPIKTANTKPQEKTSAARSTAQGYELNAKQPPDQAPLSLKQAARYFKSSKSPAQATITVQTNGQTTTQSTMTVSSKEMFQLLKSAHKMNAKGAQSSQTQSSLKTQPSSQKPRQAKNQSPRKSAPSNLQSPQKRQSSNPAQKQPLSNLQPTGKIPVQSPQPEALAPGPSSQSQRAECPDEEEIKEPASVKSDEKNVWKDKALAILKRNKESEAPVPVAPSTFEHVQFDIFGQSPLVKHFLSEKKLSRENETKVLTGRTELIDEPKSNSVSYQDILCEAFEQAIKIHETLDKLYQEEKKAIAKAAKARIKAKRKHEEEVKSLLTARTEVRQLSNELTNYILNENSTAKKWDFISTAIDKSLGRLNKYIDTKSL